MNKDFANFETACMVRFFEGNIGTDFVLFELIVFSATLSRGDFKKPDEKDFPFLLLVLF